MENNEVYCKDMLCVRQVHGCPDCPFVKRRIGRPKKPIRFSEVQEKECYGGFDDVVEYINDKPTA